MTTARSVFLRVRDLDLHARVRGDETQTPTLFLHGWLDHQASFDLLLDALHARDPKLHSVALDLRGHGDSSWCGAGGFYHLLEYVADLEGVLDALNVTQPVRIVGHSLGGAIALLYATVRSARLAHVSMLDSFPLTIRVTEVPERFSEYLNDVKLPRARKRVDSFEHAKERLLKANPRLPDAVAEHLARTGVAPDPKQDGALAWKWDPLLRGHSPLPFMDEHLRELLPLIRAPLFALRAGETWLPEEQELREKLAVTHAKLDVETLAGTGHHLHLEQPDAVAERLAAAWGRAAQA